MTNQTNAQRLADELEADKWNVSAVTLSYASEELRRLDAENAQFRAELEAVRLDADRLDFIEKNARCDPKMDGHHVWWPTSLNRALKGQTLRAAIDAAIRARKD